MRIVRDDKVYLRCEDCKAFVSPENALQLGWQYRISVGGDRHFCRRHPPGSEPRKRKMENRP